RYGLLHDKSYDGGETSGYRSGTDGEKSDDRGDKRSACHGNPFRRRGERRGDDGQSGSNERRGFIFGVPVYWRELFRDRRSVCLGGRRRTGARRQSGGYDETGGRDDRAGDPGFREK